MAQSEQEKLMAQGIAAYRDANFARALELFQSALDLQPDFWNAKLYAGMCHYKTGMVYLAVNHFRFIADNCPDAAIREKATAALGPINREARDKTVANVKQAQQAAALKADEDGTSVEWVAE
jgi:tetratricopeptide (TPR) repeat protein